MWLNVRVRQQLEHLRGRAGLKETLATCVCLRKTHLFRCGARTSRAPFDAAPSPVKVTTNGASAAGSPWAGTPS